MLLRYDAGLDELADLPLYVLIDLRPNPSVDGRGWEGARDLCREQYYDMASFHCQASFDQGVVRTNSCTL